MTNDQWKFWLDKVREEHNDSIRNPNDHVLMIDGMNTFLRCFSVINKVNPSGEHTGGLTGFLKSVGYAINLVKPTKVIIIFDGQGSSTNKRYLYPEYKANRNIEQIKNWNFETHEEESEAMASQLVRLIDYLRCLPVHLLSIDKIEADDVIGYLTTKLNKVTIMSSDRDFLQLINDKVQIYSPTKKKFYRDKEVHEEFGVWPKNFILYKTFLGDKGDNVPKVKGFGDDKLFKLIPELREDKKLTLQESMDLMRDDSKWKEKILNFKHQLDINYKLMNLLEPNIPVGDIGVIDYTVDTPNKSFDKIGFVQIYNQDMLGDQIRDVDHWLERFQYLTVF